MYEYHGWAAIHESTYEDDFDELERNIERLKERISEIEQNNHTIYLRAMNGTYFLILSGCTNHKTQTVFDIFKLFQFIKEITPGSYGLLYTRDDEDPNGTTNEFKVWVLKRGTFMEKSDEHLSPCIPEIEDGENEPLDNSKELR